MTIRNSRAAPPCSADGNGLVRPGFVICSFLGVRDEIDEIAGVGLDSEIKPPASVHACLLDVLGLVVLLGVQGWVLKVLDQKTKLLVAGLFLPRAGQRRN